MTKMCLNTRDDMLIIDLDKISFFQANGNYTQLNYIEGQQQLVTIGLTKVEELLKQTLPAGKPSPFVRLGRSLIINQNYLYGISMLRQKLILSDYCNHTQTLTVPKQLLKSYKEVITKKFTPSNQ